MGRRVSDMSNVVMRVASQIFQCWGGTSISLHCIAFFVFAFHAQLISNASFDQ